MRRIIAVLSFILVLPLAIAAAEVELVLTNGQTVRGEIVNEVGGELSLRRTVATKSGAIVSETSYKADDIAKRTAVKSAAEEYPARATGTPDTAPAQYSLAVWCRDNALADAAATHAKRALVLQPGHALARDLLGNLGWIEREHVWVLESEWLAAQGLVKYAGRYVTPADAEACKAYDQVVKVRDGLAAKVAELSHDADADAIARAGKDAAAKATAAKQATAAATDATRRAADLDKRLSDARSAKVAPDLLKQLAEQRTAAAKAATEANDAVKTATKDAASAKTAADAAGKNQTKANTDLPELRTKLAAAEKAVAAAKLKLPPEPKAPADAKAPAEPKPVTPAGK